MMVLMATTFLETSHPDLTGGPDTSHAALRYRDEEGVAAKLLAWSQRVHLQSIGDRRAVRSGRSTTIGERFHPGAIYHYMHPQPTRLRRQNSRSRKKDPSG